MSRCGLLRTCGASLIAIAHIVCTRMQDVKGPIGTVSKKILSFSAPSSKYGAAHRQWLSFVLTFADECVFQSERIAEAALPQSARLFDKIHRLADALPAVFEDTLDRFPVSFLDVFSVSSKIGWLSLVISAALSHYLGCSNSRTMNEKEITVDMGCCKNKKSDEEDASFPALQCTKRTKQPQGIESLQGAGMCDQANNNNTNVSSCMNDVLLVGESAAAKCTYKDVLTKGVKDKEKHAEEEDHVEMKKKRSPGEYFYEQEDNNGGGDIVFVNKRSHNNRNGKGKGEKDQILQLFDSSWSLC